MISFERWCYQQWWVKRPDGKFINAESLKIVTEEEVRAMYEEGLKGLKC